LRRARACGFHFDAAHGGFFQLTSRGRAALSGINQADSIALDPHKGSFLPSVGGRVAELGIMVEDACQRPVLARAVREMAGYARVSGRSTVEAQVLGDQSWIVRLLSGFAGQVTSQPRTQVPRLSA
jgi:hypothetical protein